MTSLAIVAISTLTSACSGGSDRPSNEEGSGVTACATEPLARGERVPPEEHPFVAVVETDSGGLCTGAVVAPDAILVARHCVAEEPEGIRVRSAALCGSSAPCGPFSAHAVLHQDADLAVLRLDDPLAAATSPISILLEEDFSEFRFFGYGVGTYAEATPSCPTRATPGEVLLAGDFSVEWSDEGYFGSFVAGDEPAVCEGDSGGPAVTRMGDTAYVAGLLLQSSSAGDAPCAPDGGFQLWIRLAAHWPWLRDTMGSCVELEEDGRRFARCGVE